MSLPVYIRLLTAGAIFSIAILFSPLLAGKVSRTVSTLPTSSERWALIIGINKYDDSNFNPLYGQNDAKEIARDLEEYAGFEHDQIILLTDDQPADHRPKRERILYWLSVLQQVASPPGLLLVFFSGHRMEIGGESFLIPQDAYVNFNKKYLEQNAISVKDISESLRDSQSKQVIVLVDACRNNPYAAAGPTSDKMTSGFASSFDYERHNLHITAYATIFSTSPGEQSYQYHSKQMGYFSWVLDQALSGIYDAGRQVTLQGVIEDLQDRVPRLVRLNHPGLTQTPDLYDLGGYLPGRLVLVGGYAPSVSAGSVVPTIPASSTSAVREGGTEIEGRQASVENGDELTQQLNRLTGNWSQKGDVAPVWFNNYCSAKRHEERTLRIDHFDAGELETTGRYGINVSIHADSDNPSGCDQLQGVDMRQHDWEQERIYSVKLTCGKEEDSPCRGELHLIGCSGTACERSEEYFSITVRGAGSQISLITRSGTYLMHQ